MRSSTDRMRVAGGEGKVLGQNIRHGGSAPRPRHARPPCGYSLPWQNVRSREEEHGGKAEEREVDAEIAAAAPRDDAVHQCRRAREDDRQRDPAVGGICVLVDALGLGGCGKLSGQLGIAGGEIYARAPAPRARSAPAV